MESRSSIDLFDLAAIQPRPFKRLLLIRRAVYIKDRRRNNSRGSLREPTLDCGAIHDYLDSYSCAGPNVSVSQLIR